MAIQYLAPLDNSDLSQEQAWDYLRGYRNRLLSESDWTQLQDASVDAVVWQTYRQSLRDLPETVPDPRTAEFPEPPTD
jgi:hypothetical protein